MATSLTSLQQQSNLRIWRKCEIKRRINSYTYETSWLDVSKYVLTWPTIEVQTDILTPFVFRRGSAILRFLNDKKQFSSEIFSRSVFSGYLTRYKTMVKISSGLEDEDGVQYPSASIIFIGLVTKDIIDTDMDVVMYVNDISQSLSDFHASNISDSCTSVALTAGQILGTIRDYVKNGKVLLDPFLSASGWVISSTGRTYTINTSTDLYDRSALDIVQDLAQAENSVFYVDFSGNFNFRSRSYPALESYTFNGPGSKNVNIISIDNYNEGLDKFYSKFVCNLPTESIIYTSSAYTVGDNSPVDKYGERQYWFPTYFFINSNSVGSVCSALLAQFSQVKPEINITTKYITQLNIGDKVLLNYLGEPGGDGSLWGYATWGKSLWSGHLGGITLRNKACGITGISIDMENFISQFSLKEL